MRTIEIERKTAETEIVLKLNLDGQGLTDIHTGIGFLDHMLILFTRHGSFDIKLACKGDIEVDCHHSVEDIGIVLGRAFSQALEDRKGIYRYGSFAMPMDECLVLCAIDICGRGTLAYKLAIPTEKIGDFDTELVQEFFLAFARELGASLHVHQMAGENSHHIAEAAFKGFGRALAAAVAVDAKNADTIPSTKGTIV